VLLCRKRARAQVAGIKVEAAAGSKPAAGGNTGGARGSGVEAPITIRVRNQWNNELFFMIHRSTRLEKVLNTFAQETGMCINKIKFMFDAKRVDPAATPGELEMEDGDCMDASIEQVGD
jgi:small ubiquitin-related modifier